jgi:hypothetical protein
MNLDGLSCMKRMAFELNYQCNGHMHVIGQDNVTKLGATFDVSMSSYNKYIYICYVPTMVFLMKQLQRIRCNMTPLIFTKGHHV